MKASTKQGRGFTLVEIAIVLVIIGLLLGGILKGQELINTAKVRAIADRQNSLKIAWFSFVDRYGAIPGDYNRASFHLQSAGDGNGDGLVAGDESPLALAHLTSAGYLRCAACTAKTAENPTSSNSLINNYGGLISIWHDGLHQAGVGYLAGGGTKNEATAANVPNEQLLLVHTGPRIPSNIIGEVDRKIDDGVGNQGDMGFNQYSPTSASGPDITKCIVTEGLADGSFTASVVLLWRPESMNPTVVQNCGAGIQI